jgi:hypothetical protein
MAPAASSAVAPFITSTPQRGLRRGVPPAHASTRRFERFGSRRIVEAMLLCRVAAQEFLKIEVRCQQHTFPLMEKRIVKLREESLRLGDELAAIESGAARACGTGPGGEEVDISREWAEYLRAVLAAKRSVLAKLQKLYDELDD